MEFKQKAGEKKMSMSKNIARLAVTAGLTAALSFGGVMAPVTMAFADGTPTVAESGSVTIKEDIYKDTAFKGIKIFSAKVTQDRKDDGTWDSTAEKTLSDIDWASGPVKSAVTTAFNNDKNKPTDLPTGKDAESAQAWAQFIKEHGSDADKGKNVKAGSVLDKIAAAVEKAGISEGPDGWVAANNTGSFASLATGYWLFVTKSVGANPSDDNKINTDTFTSPIFAVVGGSDEILTPKKQVPTVTKAVKDDNNGSFVDSNADVPEGSSRDVFTAPNRVADSASDQPVEYQLAGTVASNINTYEQYSYTFTDDLPSTMVPVLSGGKPAVKVKIDDATVKPDYYTVNYVTDQGKNELVVSFDNLKGEIKSDKDEAITVSGSSKIFVNYQAKLDHTKVNADILGKAQENTVTLTYSNNPHSDSEGDKGTTVVHPAYDYTYGIDVTKVGSDKDGDGNLKQLKDVEFTLQEVVGGNPENQFIDAQGVKHNDAKDATLKTTGEGKINVVGLDEGTYILKEVKPAPGYNNSAKNGVTFIIKRDSNSQLYQAGQSVIPSADSAIVATGGVVKDDKAIASTGKLSFTIVDKKGSSLPLTGLNGVTFTWIAGGAVLCIGVAHLIRSRKQAEESEQE